MEMAGISILVSPKTVFSFKRIMKWLIMLKIVKNSNNAMFLSSY